MAADLHCHTRHSDGSATVEEVILFAKGNGVSTLAITDHDTVSGWEEAARYGERYGMTVIPGIELSGYDYKRGQKSPYFVLFLSSAGTAGGALPQDCKRSPTGHRANDPDFVRALSDYEGNDCPPSWGRPQYL